jgi:glycosyltransferase involved in cell wall biosynthesis
MPELPLVSFIVPAYNVSAYIVQAVSSALHQTYSNVEVVVVDDGSIDDTVQVVKKTFEEDSRVRLFSQRNSGPAAARNRALAEARGEFVHFLDADEFILPDKVEKSYALFVQYPEIGVVYGHGIAVEPDGVTVIPMEQPPLPSGWVFCEWLTGTMSGGTHGVVSSVMARRDAVLAVGGFNESIKGTEDWDCWLRLAARYPFAALDEKLVYYRRTPHGVHANRLNMALSRLKTYQLARAYDGRAKCLNDQQYDWLLASRWHVVAERYWELGRRTEARKAFDEALKLHPTSSRRIFALLTYLVPYSVIQQFWRVKITHPGH